MNTQILKDLGFEKAAGKVDKAREKNRKMHLAYQGFEFIAQEIVEKFNRELRKKTENNQAGYTQYDKLVFIEVKDYGEVPPVETLDKLKEAKAVGCFDTFEIAKIESIKEVKDPILFGRIEGCGDYFFISQWDDDVTLEEIKAAR